MFKQIGVAVVVSLALSTSVLASEQNSTPEPLKAVSATDILNSDLESKKMLLMAEGMTLLGKQSDKFWPLYKEFLQKRKKANDDVVAIVTDLAKNPLTFTNEKVKDRFKELFAADHAILALEEEYFEKIGKATSPSIAARFLQLEDIINTMIKFQILSKLPLFPEIIEADKKSGTGNK